MIAGNNQDDPRVSVPASGNVIEINVTTYGPDCYSFGRTETQTSDRGIVVVPNDRSPPDGTPCTHILRLFQHSVRVTVDREGEYRIVVRGRRQPTGETLEVVRTISVD